MAIINPNDSVFWYLKRDRKPRPLPSTGKADVIIIGGGMAGLSAAQGFAEKGKSVIVLEKSFCGGGASGKSSGFITPDAELDLSYFNRVFGSKDAMLLWKFITSGVDLIENNIKKYSLDCDYQKQDTLILANSRSAFKEIKEESQTRKQFGYESTLYEESTVCSIIGSKDYYGGIKYGNTFGINPYAYLQEMKNILEEKGVHIFEEALVTQINPQSVVVNNSTIQAEKIVVCTDYLDPMLGAISRKTYHAQTFIMLSNPLTDKQVRQIFPKENVMVWDSDLVYQYYRLIKDNRLILGGASVFSTFWPYERHNATTIQSKLNVYQQKKFPDLKLTFPYMWPGMIGATLDIMPIAGNDRIHPSIYYIAGATGLPWAAALGSYSAKHIVENDTTMDTFFSPYRHFPLGVSLSYLIGKPLTFAISNFISMLIRPKFHAKPKKICR